MDRQVISQRRGRCERGFESSFWGDDENMKTDIPSRPGDPITDLPRRQLTRIHLANVMHGAREVILLHEGEEYRLRITKAGKLILTK
jgi:hemin uptake protein HemP